MIIAMTVLFDEGDFAVHYAAAKTLEQAHRWAEKRKESLKAQGIACSSAILNTDHIQWVEECNVDESSRP